MPKKIKILHLLPNLSQGGAEKVCCDLLLNLNQEEFSPSLLLFKENGAGNEGKKKLIARNIKIISLQKKYLLDLINFWNIFKTIKKIKPDILHTHLGGDIYGCLAGKLAGVPIIVSTEHNLNQTERGIITALKKFTSRYVVKIFAVSEAVKKDAIKRYKIVPEKITVIYNGIDLSVFKPIEHKENKPLVIGSLGRLTEQKGFETLIKAATKTENKNYLVKIAGTGNLEEMLKNKITTFNLTNRIELLGEVKAPDFLANIDIFVFPSLWEGLGLALLEAGAMAKPIIASETGGIKEIITDDNGWLFPTGNATELAAKIDLVIDNFNSEETKAKTKKIKNLVDSQFNLNMMVEAYGEWYQILKLKIKE
jgi:glycosyltransferase involved in cell wall biosynthesis